MAPSRGIVSGSKIAKKAGINGHENALRYLEDLFLYLKAGIITWIKDTNRIVIRMRESVYASGVENINMELCEFLCGIIEGVLNEATNERWDVIERKCMQPDFRSASFTVRD